jgi:hypothetical protein
MYKRFINSDAVSDAERSVAGGRRQLMGVAQYVFN